MWVGVPQKYTGVSSLETWHGEGCWPPHMSVLQFVRCQPVMPFGMMVSSRTQISQPVHIHGRETILHSDKCKILLSSGLCGWKDNNATPSRTAITVMIKQDQWPHLTVRGALRWRSGLLFLLVTPEPPASHAAYRKNQRHDNPQR